LQVGQSLPDSCVPLKHLQNAKKPHRRPSVSNILASASVRNGGGPLAARVSLGALSEAAGIMMRICALNVIVVQQLAEK
jgi:hypothetical protein